MAKANEQKNKTVELMIYSTTKKTKDGRKFKHYSTKMMLNVTDENGVVEQKIKYVTVKFPSDVNVACVTRGVLTAYVNDVSAPTKWEITTNEKGEKEFPTVWIRGIKSFREIKREHNFNFVVDEPDTEETDIDSEDIEESEE